MEERFHAPEEFTAKFRSKKDPYDILTLDSKKCKC